VLVPMLRPTHPRIATLEVAQAQLAMARGELPAAAASLQKATEILAAAGDNNQTAIRAWTLLARVELDLFELGRGELPTARVHAAKAVALGRAAMAGFAHSAWLGYALLVEGMTQRASGETAAAQTTLRAALEELQATLGVEAPAARQARDLLAELE
jgi:hypothetical protein